MQTQEDLLFEDATQVDDILVLDVGARSFEEGMRVAGSRLQQRGWVFEGEGVTFTGMTSTRWEDTSLTIRSLMANDSYGADMRDLVGKEVAGDRTDWSKYLIVVIAPVSQ